jgi:predicted metal-dependent phosphotriesterase family hydrolase
MMIALIEAGFLNKLMFSSDLSSFNQTKTGKCRGHPKTWTIFAPRVKAAGGTDEQIHTITLDNPRRFLALLPKKPSKGQKVRIYFTMPLVSSMTIA